MERKWWKEGVAYQIYVRSFKDSNGDGIGDLRGIIEKLDYIKSLGVDMIYLNPINKSPNEDNGYDISDFEDIMLEFGDLEDFDGLLRGIHQRNMKLIMDMVINHSSDEHPWFIEAKKSKENKYRDYYIWSKGKDNNPPNNWGSFFGGSAWELDENTGEYYLHIFSKKQPDLNWTNKGLRQDMKNMLKYWVGKGVDGFRMDAINHLAKDMDFPDGEIKEGALYGDFIPYVQNLPEVHDYLKELKRDVFTDSHVVIGETGGINYENAHVYTGVDNKELDFTFHFDLHSVGKGENPWERVDIDLIKDVKEKMTGWATRAEKEGWCPVFYSNHDTTRTVSRLGDDKNYHKLSAKMLATLQLTHKGTPFIYYGDEIGMTNANDFKLEDYRDASIFTRYSELVLSGLVSHENYIKGLNLTSRDNSRTPMQWNDKYNAGFTSAIPWIKVNSNYQEVNVEQQEKDYDSILNYYKKLIALRNKELTLVYGDFEEVDKENTSIYAYLRTLGNKKVLVICNFFGGDAQLKLSEDILLGNFKLEVCNYENNEYNSQIKNQSIINLRPYESRVYICEI